MYARKRHFVFMLIACIAIALPFIRINANHFFLLSFDKKELHLLFTRFDMQELYLMPFVVMILFLFIFFMTTLGGRVWCGWSCPQTMFRTVYRDFIQTKLLGIRKSTDNKQTETKNGIGKILSVVIWGFISVFIACNFMWYFVPPEDFFVYIQNPAEHKVLVGIVFFITLWLIFDITFLGEKFCVYICPYARIQSVMFDNDTMQVIYDEKRGGKVYENGKKLWRKPPNQEDECVGCEACVKICPTHIDIRKGMQLDCINCLECVDACTPVMAKFNKSSLIKWSSHNAVSTNQKVKFARFRTVAYCIILAVACSVLVLMSGKKEYMLLNINRTSELYNVTAEGSVENYYVFLFQNTDKKDHVYYFDTNNTNLSVISPSEPMNIKAGHKKRVVVTLASEQPDIDKDLPIKIKINAFATDDKERINVERETVFVYPKKIR